MFTALMNMMVKAMSRNSAVTMLMTSAMRSAWPSSCSSPCDLIHGMNVEMFERSLRSTRMEEYERERFQTENRRLYRLYMKASMIKALTTPALEVLAAFAIGGVVWYGGNSVIAISRRMFPLASEKLRPMAELTVRPSTSIACGT